jgi:uncharacterized membrane protein
MIRAAQSIFVSALGLWVGGMATLAFIVAPATFRAAPSRAVAGSIFGSILQSFGSVQIILALLCVASLIVLTLTGGLRGRNGLLRIATVSIMLALVLVSQFHVAPAIARERETIPNFDALPPGVPQKARFDSLHKTSVRLGGVTLFLGLGLLVCATATLRSADGA